MVGPQSAPSEDVFSEVIQQLEDDAIAHQRIARQNRELAAEKLELRRRVLLLAEALDIPVKLAPRKKRTNG